MYWCHMFSQEIQDRIRILELYAKDRQFASFVRQHQAWVSSLIYEIWGSGEVLLLKESVCSPELSLKSLSAKPTKDQMLLMRNSHSFIYMLLSNCKELRVGHNCLILSLRFLTDDISSRASVCVSGLWILAERIHLHRHNICQQQGTFHHKV